MNEFSPGIMKHFLITAILLLVCQITFSQKQAIEVSVQRGHSGAVLISAASADGKVLATAGKDKTIKIWEIKNGRELRTLPGHEYSVLTIAFFEGLLASSDGGGTVKIWDYTSGTLISSWQAHDGAVVDHSFNAGGNLILTGGTDSKVRVWDWRQKKLVHEYKLDGGQNGLKCSFSADDRKIAVAGDNGTVVVYSTKAPAESDTLRNLDYSFCGGCYTEARFSADDKWLATAADRGSLLLHEAGNLKNKHLLKEKIEDFNNLSFSRDGKFLLVSFNNHIELYDIDRKTLALTLPKQEKSFNHAVFSGDGKSFFISTDANETLMFARDGQYVKSFRGKLNDPVAGDLNLDPNAYWESHAYKIAMLKNRFVTSADGRWAIKGRSGDKVIVWDLQKGKPYRILEGHPKAVISFAFSPDGEKLVSGDADGGIIMWDLVSGDTLATRKAHFNMVLCFAFSSDGNLLASGGYDGYLNIFEAGNLKPVKRKNFSGSSDYLDSPFSLSFSPNDLYLLAGSLGKTFKMLETDTGEEFQSYTGHTNVVSKSIFVDEHTMVSSSWDGRVKAWNYRTGYQEWKIAASHIAINDLISVKEKNWIITAGADRNIKIWDVATRQLFHTLSGHGSQVISLNYLAKDNILVSSTDNGEVKYWSLESFDNLVTQYFTGPQNWVIINQQGYFNATPGASDAVAFVNGLESYQPEQFFEKFYDPDLLPLSYQTSRSVNTKTNLAEVINKFPPPIVEIIVPKHEQEFTRPDVNILIKTTNAGGSIDEIRLTHNGKSIIRKIEEDSKLQQKGRSLIEGYDLELLPGKNVIEASAFNKERMESEKARVVVEYKGKSVVNNCYLVVIGINKYKNSTLNLNFARPDAESFAGALQKNTSQLYNKTVVYELYDQQATKANVLDALEKVASQARPSDVLYFYYAGHGSMADNSFYFIPTDNVRLFDSNMLESDAISDATIRDKLKNIQALKQVVIIDACQSGGGVETIALRGAGNEKALAQLSRSAGVHVLASAGSEQFASEFKEIGHGLFTYTLLEALNGEADGAPKDGSISIFEIKSYLDAKVPVYSEQFKGQPQYPYTFSIGQDFPVLLNLEK